MIAVIEGHWRMDIEHVLYNPWLSKVEIKMSSGLTCKDPQLGRDDEDLEYLETQLPGKFPATKTVIDEEYY